MKQLMKGFLLAGAMVLSAHCLVAQVPEVKWDSRSLIIGGKRVVPVMGEVHYSRIPADEWQREVRKMKDGGVTIIANYVFGTMSRSRRAYSTGADSATCAASLRFARPKACPWCCA